MGRAAIGDGLAAVNAALNGLSGLLLWAGWRAIRRRDVEQHRARMVAAFAGSALFLVCYLVRVALTGAHPFPGRGPLRALYFVLLGTHMLLAIAVPPLAIRTLFLALRSRIDEHRRLVRWTLPIWLYVSVTGVLVYLMLYHLPPGWRGGGA